MRNINSSNICQWLLGVLLVAAVSSCGSSKKAATVRPGDGRDLPAVTEKRKPQQHNGAPEFDVDRSLADRIVDAAKSWIGTPYLWGGQTKEGTDCSGLTMVLYQDVAGVSIPRNSARQCEYCVGIGREDLQPGDLIFFTSNTSGDNVGHVGLYIGGGNMIHASASRGVMSSNIDERYWRLHYHSSGRVNAATYAMTSTRRQKPAKNNRHPEAPASPATPDFTPVEAVREPVDYAVASSDPVQPEYAQPASPVAITRADRSTEPQTATSEDTAAGASSDTDYIPTPEEIAASVENAFN